MKYATEKLTNATVIGVSEQWTWNKRIWSGKIWPIPEKRRG